MLKIDFRVLPSQPVRGTAVRGTAVRGTQVIAVSEAAFKAKAWRGYLGALDKRARGLVRSQAKLAEFTGAAEAACVLNFTEKNMPARLVLLGIGKADAFNEHACEKLGARALAHAKKAAMPLGLVLPADVAMVEHETAARAGLGARMGIYRFTRYKSRATKKPAFEVPALTIFCSTAPAATKSQKEFAPLAALSDGICLARDLVNEPANVLSPPEFARRIKTQLGKRGVKVSVFGEKRMEALKMRTLLAVGEGSAHESQMVVMHWRGRGAQKKNKNKKPLVFIGKGVCFDTGGISLKPPANMGDMKGDMGGAAAVTGLMYALAARNAPVDAIGVVGLVENMPGSRAQRPGDIVTSMSGQTVEVLNTDAEGRLVLADLLWYAQKKLKPEFMVNLATLTGAIIMALGKEYAGLFSNNDRLAERLVKIGMREEEKVWRFPLHKAFDKMIDSKNADMQNIGGAGAGSITAAQFLQRFTNGVPWAHLDIAGVAMGAPQSVINRSWASGFGVKLLDRFVREHYEG